MSLSAEMEARMTIAPTIDVGEAADRPWDAVVIGAGPSGALTARELARSGWAVLLVDRASFPRNKVCGSCINQRALAMLSVAGLEHVVRSRGAVPLRRMCLAVQGRQATILLPGGVALSRRQFDAALVEEAINAGAALLPETTASLAPCESGTRRLRLNHNGHQGQARSGIVIAANGLAGNLLAAEVPVQAARCSRLGAGALVDDPPDCYEPGTIYMACGLGGYVGLVRLEDGALDVAAAFDPRYVLEIGHLGKAAESLIQKAGLPRVPRLAERDWRGTPLLTRRLKQPCGDRVLAVGDAAGYVEPFTGEGIAWALESAAAAVKWLTQPDTLHACDWPRHYHRTITKRQWVCRIVAASLRRPRLVRAGISILARAPVLAAPILSYLNGTRRRWDLNGGS